MTQRADVTLPMLLLASMTAYGFLLVWAQTDPIELTTNEDPKSPKALGGFSVLTGENVSIELEPWYSTSIVPAVTTHVRDTTADMGSTPTTYTSLWSPTIHLPTAAPDQGGATTVTRGAEGSTARTDPSMTPVTSPGNANIIPRSLKRSANYTDRVSLKVKIRSSAPKDEVTKLFLQKVCDFLATLQPKDLAVTLGPEKVPMQCPNPGVKPALMMSP
ncbi:uncharacterized protein RB166_007075 [Leptodactylus fuscus]|uniref:uncharacterized protein LOC142201234 n=1 Tax=Leptodactylus fuscus TaxID=238119 RepID=UPI003F4EA840